jgi:hypothetical protein
MHFERGRVHEKSWADEFFVHVVVAQDVADILTEKTLDALSKLLHPFDILRGNPPSAIGRVGLSRLELRDALLYPIIPRYVRDQVFHVWKCLHGFDCHRSIKRESVQSRHAHQFRHAIDFGGAGATFPRLAVPANRQIASLFRLYPVYYVEYDHTC